MENKLIVQVKNVYGKTLIYPANETAKQFADLIGVKTLSLAQLRMIQALGFEIEETRESTEYLIKGLLK